MLVLTRRSGESIRIGDDVSVTVLEVRGDVVRLGIAAPRSIAVHRDELYRELRRANEQAARSEPADDARLAALLGTANRDPATPRPGPGPRPDPRPSPSTGGGGPS